MNPNWITAVRFPLALLAFYCLIIDGTKIALAFAIAIMALAEISDIMDGRVARRYGKVSKVGKVLDPIADSFYHLAVFVAFVIAGWMWWSFLIIFILRDLISYVFRLISYIKSAELGARRSGKLKAIFQGTAQISTVVLYLIAPESHIAQSICFLLLGSAIVMTVISGADYLHQAYKVLRPAPHWFWVALHEQ